MRAVIQRVRNASVTVNETIVGSCPFGLLIYVGIAKGDTEADTAYGAKKISGLRIFEDTAQKMNLSLSDINGSALIISQFTLLGDVRRGRRPSYDDSEHPERALLLYTHFVHSMREQNIHCETGIFGAPMSVTYTNEGPVTIFLDSKH
ncbi:MAG: D-tyrosyl-tRNA(Tyr) deacylase [Treponema sp.]|jgi:D-tyrosyl-tRNA(Tyr) deacylase|nr:D-tyrosyl-tRNA(Tyr) deacylase [Treponema sp.]